MWMGLGSCVPIQTQAQIDAETRQQYATAVMQLYQLFMKRPASESELNQWVGALMSGTPFATVQAQLNQMGQQEAQAVLAQQAQQMKVAPSRNGTPGEIATSADGTVRYQWQNGHWSTNVCDQAGYHWVDDGISGLGMNEGWSAVEGPGPDRVPVNTGMLLAIGAAAIAAVAFGRGR